MRVLHLGLTLALLVGWTVAAEAAPAKGKKGTHATGGVVVAVQKDKDTDSGTLTVKVHHKKKSQAGQATAAEKTFKVTSATKFELVTRAKGQKGQKAQSQQTAATFAAVHKGEHVHVIARGDVAEVVKITKHNKKKK